MGPTVMRSSTKSTNSLPMLELSERLLMVANMVRPGKILADIGTDHAYLPCELVKNGKIPAAIAADIASGPLKNAEVTVRRYGLTDKVECRRSDGLSAFNGSECEEIVLAGMGGNLIVDILSAAPWLHNPKFHLLLQPMTHSEDVRCFLLHHGFSIDNESAVIDKSGKVYIAISAYYDSTPGNMDLFTCYFGPHAVAKNDASRCFAEKQKNRLEKKRNGLLHTFGDCKQLREIEDLLNDERLKGL